MKLTADERQQTLSDIRELLDFVESRPEIELSGSFTTFYLYPSLWSDEGKVAFWHTIKALGSFEKDFMDTKLKIIKRFGNARICMEVSRDKVCTKRTVRKMVDVEEWDCGPLLSEAELAEVMA